MATKKSGTTAAPSKKAAAKTVSGEVSGNGNGNGTGEPKAAKAAPAKKGSSLKADLEAAAPSPGSGKAAPSHAEIAQLAHKFWEERGHHHGSHHADWLRAEHELKNK